MKAKLLLFLLLLLTACKIEIKNDDLISYNLYDINDTLVFKNKSGQVNKFQIISKSIINKGWDENTGFYNPQVAYIKYKDLTNPSNTYQETSFMTIYQRSKDEIEETIYFNGFLGSINRKTQKTEELIPFNQANVYKIPKFDMTTVRDSTDISYVYWSDKYGIVAYDNKKGDRWILQK